ncbi:MAG: putative NAD/FAD-binding protein, partial [Planctomycetota bacterium]
MKVCIVGSGISGLVAAHHLHRDHEVTVFEAADWVGGHTNTVDVETPAGPLAIDTGFIVFNEHTYPGFTGLLRELDVPWDDSDMSFSARCEETGLEYNGTNFNGLFAQRSNLLSPSFWRMVREIMRFYREAPAILDEPDDKTTLGEYLERGGYSKLFVEKHIVPMAAAVWSATPETMYAFPMRFLVQFFQNHGFLRVNDRPQWLVVRGGSREYVKRMIVPFRDRIRLNTPIVRVEKKPDGIHVRSTHGDEGIFDRVILATHADTSLAMLADPTPLQSEILGAFRFQKNEAVLHSDPSLMPKRKRAWASWNYHVAVPSQKPELPAVTYWMDNLQGLKTQQPYFLTLNRTEAIDPDLVLRSFQYDHPIFSTETVLAQGRHGEIDGSDGIH